MHNSGIHRTRKLWLAYLLAVPFGCLGAHRFYLGRERTGAAIACIWLAGFFLAWCIAIAAPTRAAIALWESIAGLLMLAAWSWELVDLFLLPGMVRRFNARLAPQPPPLPDPGQAS